MLLSPAGQAESRAEVLPSSLNALAESPGQAEVKPSPPYPPAAQSGLLGIKTLVPHHIQPLCCLESACPFPS